MHKSNFFLFIPENRSLEGDIQYAEFKMSDSQWENGIFAFDADVKNGFELVKFNGTSAAEMAKIALDLLTNPLIVKTDKTNE